MYTSQLPESSFTERSRAAVREALCQSGIELAVAGGYLSTNSLNALHKRAADLTAQASRHLQAADRGSAELASQGVKREPEAVIVDAAYEDGRRLGTSYAREELASDVDLLRRVTTQERQKLGPTNRRKNPKPGLRGAVIALATTVNFQLLPLVGAGTFLTLAAATVGVTMSEWRVAKKIANRVASATTILARTDFQRSKLLETLESGNFVPDAVFTEELGQSSELMLEERMRAVRRGYEDGRGAVLQSAYKALDPVVTGTMDGKKLKEHEYVRAVEEADQTFGLRTNHLRPVGFTVVSPSYLTGVARADLAREVIRSQAQAQIANDEKALVVRAIAAREAFVRSEMLAVPFAADLKDFIKLSGSRGVDPVILAERAFRVRDAREITSTESTFERPIASMAASSGDVRALLDVARGHVPRIASSRGPAVGM